MRKSIIRKAAKIFGKPVRTWAADYRSVTVAFTCERGDDARTVLRNATEAEASPAAAADDQVAT